jgi:hypothetical protein
VLVILREPYTACALDVQSRRDERFVYLKVA